MIQLIIFISVQLSTVFGKRLVCLENECELELVLRHRFTMSCLANNGEWYPIVATPRADAANEFDISPTTNLFDPNIDDLTAKNLTFDEENCIFGDGTRTSVVSINDQFPGPSIEIGLGAKVHITVTNMLHR